MESLTLTSGARMPLVGFGTWQLQGESGLQAILQALQAGYRLLDTARMYGNEQLVGQAVRQSGLPRSRLFLTSKLCGTSTDYRTARADIEQSLRRLQTDYLDLMLIHEPYPQTPQLYRALEDACRAGQVRDVGVSNFSAAQYLELRQSCRIPPAVNQVESHVYHARLKLNRLLQAHGTRMQAWSPLVQGQRRLFQDPVLQAVGAAHGKTAAQAALRYLVEQGIGVIPRSSHPRRMRENLDLFDFCLTEQERRRIAALDQGRSLFGWD